MSLPWTIRFSEKRTPLMAMHVQNALRYIAALRSRPSNRQLLFTYTLIVLGLMTFLEDQQIHLTRADRQAVHLLPLIAQLYRATHPPSLAEPHGGIPRVGASSPSSDPHELGDRPGAASPNQD